VRRLLLVLWVVWVAGCASTPPVTQGPTSDPARVADGFRVTPMESQLEHGRLHGGAASDQVARVNLTVGGVTVTQTVPANTPLAIEFDSQDTRWVGLPAADRWYLVKLDGVQQAHAGVLVETSPAHFRTPTNAYVFPPGSHTAEVSLVYPASQVVECAPGTPGCDNSCTVGQDCYGQPTPVSVQATSAVLTGAPPSVTNGQVVR